MLPTKQGTCECCETTDVGVIRVMIPEDPYRPMSSDVVEAWYCDFCCSTMASTWMRSGTPKGHILMGVAYVGNAVMKELAALRKEIRDAKGDDR